MFKSKICIDWHYWSDLFQAGDVWYMACEKCQEAVSLSLPDPRDCGWLGCGHARCEKICANVTIDEWYESRD